jgi:Spy/CpxP family protein refolding chaperone
MIRWFVIAWLSAMLLAAQGPPGPPGRGGPPHRGGPGDDRPGPDMFAGKWWTNPMTVLRLGLTDDQQKRLEEIYQQSRLHLIDLRASLEKEEASLEPLLASEHPPETTVLSQIDRIANARAELEKANARMLFSFRLLLTPDQWKELQSRGGPGRR